MGEGYHCGGRGGSTVRNAGAYKGGMRGCRV